MCQRILSVAETVVQSHKDQIQHRASKCALLHFLHIWIDVFVVFSDTATVSAAEPSKSASPQLIDWVHFFWGRTLEGIPLHGSSGRGQLIGYSTQLSIFHSATHHFSETEIFSYLSNLQKILQTFQ